MRDVIVIAVNVLIPASVLVAWLISEFRFRRSVRVALGLSLTLILLFHVWLTASLGDSVIFLHYIGLSQIERRLEEGRDNEVRRALKAYRETYEETKNSQTSALQMNRLLFENSPLVRKTKTGEENENENENRSGLFSRTLGN